MTKDSDDARKAAEEYAAVETGYIRTEVPYGPCSPSEEFEWRNKRELAMCKESFLAGAAYTESKMVERMKEAFEAARSYTQPYHPYEEDCGGGFDYKTFEDYLKERGE